MGWRSHCMVVMNPALFVAAISAGIAWSKARAVPDNTSKNKQNSDTSNSPHVMLLPEWRRIFVSSYFPARRGLPARLEYIIGFRVATQSTRFPACHDKCRAFPGDVWEKCELRLPVFSSGISLTGYMINERTMLYACTAPPVTYACMLENQFDCVDGTNELWTLSEDKFH